MSQHLDSMPSRSEISAFNSKFEGALLPSGSNLLDAPAGEWAYVASQNLTNTPCSNGLVRVYKTTSSTSWTLMIVTDPLHLNVTYLNFKTSSWSGWQISYNNNQTFALISGAGTSFTIPNNYRGRLVTVDSNTDRCGEWLIYATGAGSIGIRQVIAASVISLTTDTNVLTIRATDGGTPSVLFDNIQGVAKVQ